jgi:uncharacterized protein with ParB-like and HNH nuclease domain
MQVSIYQLLDSDEMKFDVPVYQRPYSWGTKQVFEMITDFKKAYEARQEYFLGAIVSAIPCIIQGEPVRNLGNFSRM